MRRGYGFVREADDGVSLVLSYQVRLSVMGQVVGIYGGVFLQMLGFHDTKDNHSFQIRSVVSFTIMHRPMLTISESTLVNCEISRNGREYSRKSDAGSQNGMESSHHS